MCKKYFNSSPGMITSVTLPPTLLEHSVASSKLAPRQPLSFVKCCTLHNNLSSTGGITARISAAFLPPWAVRLSMYSKFYRTDLDGFYGRQPHPPYPRHWEKYNTLVMLEIPRRRSPHPYLRFLTNKEHGSASRCCLARGELIFSLTVARFIPGSCAALLARPEV